MTQLTMSQANRAARNAATIALADFGPGNSSIRIRAGQGGALLATRTLAKPCGTVRVADGRIQLVAAAVDDLVTATGAARWAEWVSGDGVEIGAGRVTDAAGNYTDGTGAVVPDPLGPGFWQLGGTAGTQLYLGGQVLLYSALIG
jgi:hypothetical protein